MRRHGLAFRLSEASVGDRLEIVSLSDMRFARASTLLGLVEGITLEIRRYNGAGSMVVDIDGDVLRIPRPLCQTLECRAV
tara:strand:+ start:265 stop:504 length:240 start_codon:yes stop_codon:yes gene_type:complete